MTFSANQSEPGSVLRAVDTAALVGVLLVLAATASAAEAVRRRRSRS
jgi:hypothetical protein